MSTHFFVSPILDNFPFFLFFSSPKFRALSKYQSSQWASLGSWKSVQTFHPSMASPPIHSIQILEAWIYFRPLESTHLVTRFVWTMVRSFLKLVMILACRFLRILRRSQIRSSQGLSSILFFRVPSSCHAKRPDPVLEPSDVGSSPSSIGLSARRR